MEILLPLHILAGITSLLCAALAVSCEKGKKLHVLSGRTYFWGMVTIFLTAIPMSIISNNIFLFLIAVFSFYLAFQECASREIAFIENGWGRGMHKIEMCIDF